MSEAKERNICARDRGHVETRMFVTLLRLGRVVPVSGLDAHQVAGLNETAKKLGRKRLLYILSLDSAFAGRPGTEINNDLKKAAEEIKNDSKGGEQNGIKS